MKKDSKKKIVFKCLLRRLVFKHIESYDKQIQTFSKSKCSHPKVDQ